MSKLYIDIGGTYLRSELLEKGKVHKEKILSHRVSLNEYLEKRLKRYPDITLIGISFAGQVDHGKILSAPNITVEKADIKRYIEKKYGVVLKIDNDLNCALLAEKQHTEEKNMALLYIGTGMGSAVLEQGNVVRGERNLAYEIGHVPFKKAPFKCGCGKDNCLELFSSGSGLEKWYAYYGLPPMTIEELKCSGDKHAKKIYKNFLEGILRASATIVTLSNPKVLILGGGIIISNPFLKEKVEKKIRKYALSSNLEGLDIALSQFKNASMEGAKLL
ncbi:MAG: ROK family transcriptional regulator [Epsilonproteobacteria bacterium (ex Lamellibrachia satsuma)]|nr:MAG: ROK family transcriptional regulator [Epsilonproteobacteria bacterium (ex Lamellibrachia satsuma)]